MKLPNQLPRVGSFFAGPTATLTFLALSCGGLGWIGVIAGLAVWLIWHPRSPINPPDTIDALRSQVPKQPEC